MRNVFRNKNFWIIVSLLTVALILLLTTADRRNDFSVDADDVARLPVINADSFSLDDFIDYTPKSSSLSPLFSAMAEEETPAVYTREALEAVYTAKAYVLVSFSNWGKIGVIALPDENEENEETVIPLQQPIFTDDGEYISNELHLTPDSMYIAHANCDSQDCIYQGVVTLENKDSRILGNMIICSPHGLLLELYTRDELIDYILSAQF